MLDRLGAVSEVVVRSHEGAVGCEESGHLVVVAGVEGGDEVLDEVADQGLNVQGGRESAKELEYGRYIYYLLGEGKERVRKQGRRRSSVHPHSSARNCGKRKNLQRSGGSG